MTIHLVAYTATTPAGTTQGVARVRSNRRRPSWRECAQRIDGYATGRHLGVEPQYTLTYATESGSVTRRLGAGQVQRIGTLVARAAARGDVWDVAVRDADGSDVTFNFSCFCA